MLSMKLRNGQIFQCFYSLFTKAMKYRLHYKVEIARLQVTSNHHGILPCFDTFTDLTKRQNYIMFSILLKLSLKLQRKVISSSSVELMYLCTYDITVVMKFSIVPSKACSLAPDQLPRPTGMQFIKLN